MMRTVWQRTSFDVTPNGVRTLLGILTICWLQTPDATAFGAPGRHGSAAGDKGSPQTQAWQVTIVDLELLPGGTYASAYAINDSGKIVGMANDGTGALKTVQWLNGRVSTIPALEVSAASVPEDVNDGGEITGTHHISNRLYLGIYWDPFNTPFQLPAIPDGSPFLVRAHAVNALGQIAGMGQEGPPNYWGHAAVWLKDSLQRDLGFMGGGHYSEAYGINDFGAVVGVAQVANTNQHAFLWQEGQYTDLSTWEGGGAASVAYAINNRGEIVGLNASVASIWRDGAVHALPMPPGVSAYTPAIDINDAGDIIATGSKGYPIDVGVLWRNGEPIDLGTLPGGTISRARRINASGEIVGEANTGAGPFHAVKWIVSPSGGVNCDAIRTLTANCKRGKLTAKVKSSLSEGTQITVSRNGGDQKTAMLNARGTGKIKWTGLSGPQIVAIVECPEFSRELQCP